jgi:hypothetical protein
VGLPTGQPNCTRMRSSLIAQRSSLSRPRSQSSTGFVHLAPQIQCVTEVVHYPHSEMVFPSKIDKSLRIVYAFNKYIRGAYA